MIATLVTKIAAGVAVSGLLVIGLTSVIPHLPNTTGVWLDSPLDKATIEAGSTHFVAHSDLPDVTAIRMVLTLNGEDAASLTDPDLQKVARGKDAKPLYRFDQPWTATAGVYDIVFYTKSAGSDFVERRHTTLTVVDQAPVAVDMAEGTSTPTPTETATPEPTETPTEEPTVAPTTPPAAPSTPVPPAPSATSTPPPAAVVTAGSVTRVQGTDDWSNTFYVTGASPQSATVSVQVSNQASGSTTWTGWTDTPCSSLVYDSGSGASTRYKCQTGSYRITPVSGPGEWYPTQNIRYRVKLVSNGSPTYSAESQYQATLPHAK